MKKITFSLLLLICISVVSAQHITGNLPVVAYHHEGAAFNWTETSFDFGKIPLNKPATHEFTFINKGNASLVISSVQASCGCTVTEYSKEPIAPGQQGFVKATYNAAKEGAFTKTVTINANTNETVVVLTIKGEVTTVQ